MASQHDSGNASTGKRRKTTSGNESTTASLTACLECRNRKVKCNREVPRCSNCQNSGVPCEFPDPERKSSQTKQLAEDVATFNAKLSTIEQNLTRRVEVLTDLVSQSVKGSQATRDNSSGIPPQIVNDLDTSDLDDEPPSGPSSPDSSGTGPYSPSIIVNDGPVERFYGESSTYSHLVRSRNLVEKLLHAGRNRGPNEGSSRRDSIHDSPALPGVITGDPSIFAEVQRKYDLFSGTSKFKEYFEIGDDKPLELPPRQELEDAIKLLLSEHSLEPPLFHKQTLDGAVEEQYQLGRLEVDESWILCFNNIILRSSAWKSRMIRVNSFATTSVNDNVHSLLLANANRALRQLERFCVLRMVNVQALFLLALVARDSIHYNVFERIFDRVCQLAKQMGLHERGVVGTDPTPVDVERQNVLWLLYSVDKQRIFLRGPPCRIYLFECHIQLPQANDSGQKLVAAGLRLTCLIEQVFRHLYSPKAYKNDARTRQYNVNRLNTRLESLPHHFEGNTTSAEQGSNAEMMLSLQLRYAFYVTELLIHSKAMDEQSKTQVVVFEQKYLTPGIGSEFSDLDLVDALESPDADALFRDLAITISERGVAVFRNQHLDNESHKRVINRIATASGRPAENDVMINALYPLYGDDPKVITLIPERVAERYGYQTDPKKRQSSAHEWHSDMSFEENPCDYSSLRLGQVPETGGDTLYASAYDLYDRMSEPFQKLFENLKVQWGDPHYTQACSTEGTYKGPRGSPANIGFGFDAVHPAVRTNPVTGWNAIFAGGMHCRGFQGITEDESNRLKTMIEDLVTKNHDIQARIRWEAPGDIAIWDNRAVKHIPTRDIEGKGKRKGYRVLSAGEKPFLAAVGTGRQVWRDAQKDGGLAGRIDRGEKVETGLKEETSLEGMSGNVNGVTVH